MRKQNIEKIYKCRKRPNTTACTATTLAAPAAKTTTIPPTSPAKRTVLVPYTPRLKKWGSWQVRSLYASSTVVNPHTVHKQELDEKQKEEELGREEEKGELAYEPHSPYYSPVHLPEFYENEYTFILCMIKIYIIIVYIFMDLVECISKTMVQ